jgi:predicted nuclease of predicted toxin-antitoxin system
VRFYLDEDLSGKIAEIARRMGVDIVSAHECENVGSDDEAHLAFAAREGRCLVTRNRDHFIMLTVKFFEQQRPHAGVLVVPYTLPSDHFSLIARAIARYDGEHPEGIADYGLDYVAKPHG